MMTDSSNNTPGEKEAVPAELVHVVVESLESPNALGTDQKDGTRNQYPPLRTVLLVVAALYIAMFIVSLVELPSSPHYPYCTLTSNYPRTVSLSPPPCQKSPTTFAPSRI